MTRQIRDQLDQMINAGTLAVGAFLPSERELAEQVKVARNVVRGAYEQLMSVGKIQSEGRRGRTVRSGGKKRTGTGKTKSPAKARKK
jgi:DNA-binding GntR family transcriptional regulator